MGEEELKRKQGGYCASIFIERIIGLYRHVRVLLFVWSGFDQV